MQGTRDLLFEFESFPKVCQGSFCNPEINFYFFLGSEGYSGLVKLFLERIDLLFEIGDVFAEGSLNRSSIKLLPYN